MASENELGACSCPVCNGKKASLRLSAKQLVYVHCNSCHSQTFARSDVSDMHLRARLIAAEPEPELEVPAAAAAAAPIAAAPAPAAKKPSWGMQW